MKIKLDEKEIAQIVKEWAMITYKTKNVSVLYEIDITPAKLDYGKAEGQEPETILRQSKLNSIGMAVEIILRDEDYGGATSQLAEEAINRVKGNRNVNTNTEADFTPRQDNNTVPLS